MSSIVTFYSYKGGVGRSMALANIAVLLAREGLKVLAVDWDLEAPGLERYFGYFEIRQGGPGLLRMCMEARDAGTADYTKFTSAFDCEGTYPITLLASGREVDDSYTLNLEAFDWEAFFGDRGGAFIENLRLRWREDFDIVLIDSRTGLSDTGGICTIQMPDIVVCMFTANFQSLYGVRDVMRLAQKARQTLAYDRMPLSVLPLPTRWGVQEFQESQLWLDRVTEAMAEFFEDWLPRGLRPRDVVEAIKVPQMAYFGFGERLAVVEQGTSDPQGMGFVYSKVASFLASNFADIGALVGEQKARAARKPVPASVRAIAAAPVEPLTYLYDIFVSYDARMSEWVLEFVERLKDELTLVRGETPKIFVDVREINAGELWADRLANSLLRSKVLLAFITPRYLTSQFARKEFMAFSERARLTGKSVLVPLLVRGEEFPDFVREFAWLDLRTFAVLKAPSKGSDPLQREIQKLAQLLSQYVDSAPPFDASWRELTERVYKQAHVEAGLSEAPLTRSGQLESEGAR
jgi:MinD-like ATPase involved in chromosome partitioning or flagellar assembly